MNRMSYLWAKTADGDTGLYHPLPLHLLDVAACADVLLEREPESTRSRMASILGLDWETARPWLLLLISCHDLGKACPAFQLKWQGKGAALLSRGGFHVPGIHDTHVNHAFVSQYALENLLTHAGWPESLAQLCADAAGCHHGSRASSTEIAQRIPGNRFGVDARNWETVWEDLFSAMCKTFGVGVVPRKTDLSGPDFMLLAGLISFVDWIGSNEDWFVFGTPQNCDDLRGWFDRRRMVAEKALDAIGWEDRTPLLGEHRTFFEVFPKCRPPRHLQEVVAQAAEETDPLSLFLIEAPMGEGKTEAAFYAHIELQRRFGHRGLYVAMPTKATGNAIFTRMVDFLRSMRSTRTLDLQLLHGAAQLNKEFQNLRFAPIYGEDKDSTIRAGDWFTHKKRALLSEYGVGTVDQALLTILPVRHYFVRLWGLANRVVIFDEIHAYDAYTGTLLFHLIRWLRSLGSSVILLSATVSPEFRRRLAHALGATLPDTEVEYPRLTVFPAGGARAKQTCIKADPARRRKLCVRRLGTKLEDILVSLKENLPHTGYAAVVVNTVQRAQDLYNLLGDGECILENNTCIGKRLADDTEVHLLHARFPADERQIREKEIFSVYGEAGTAGTPVQRSGRRILVGTQVVEQSLDLDFDMMITDLAPVDLVLQRAGRVWRHERGTRPLLDPLLCIAGLAGHSPGPFGDPLWWDHVYHESILIRTWQILRDPAYSNKIVLPDALDSLVECVYEGLAMPTDQDVLERLDKTELETLGEQGAQRTMAHQSIIGLPDDGSWKDTSRFYLYDEDEPGAHRSLIAQTRLGEDSVTVIPMLPDDRINGREKHHFEVAKVLASRALTLSRKKVVRKFRALGVPDGWQRTPLLRNCYPMPLDENGCWIEDPNVRLDTQLGIVYTPEETL